MPHTQIVCIFFRLLLLLPHTQSLSDIYGCCLDFSFDFRLLVVAVFYSSRHLFSLSSYFLLLCLFLCTHTIHSRTFSIKFAFFFRRTLFFSLVRSFARFLHFRFFSARFSVAVYRSDLYGTFTYMYIYVERRRARREQKMNSKAKEEEKESTTEQKCISDLADSLTTSQPTSFVKTKMTKIQLNFLLLVSLSVSERASSRTSCPI